MALKLDHRLNPAFRLSRKHLNFQQVLTNIDLTPVFLVFNIHYMALAWCGVRVLRAFSFFIFLTLSLLQSAPARQWDTAGASRAFKEARQKRDIIEQTTQATLSQYIECARTYRKVYLLDPHYGRSSDAIYEEGRIYQELGDRFSSLDHYKTAANRFNLLLKEYEGNQNCPDALMRLAAIYSNQLKNDDAAQKIYQQLRTKYKSLYASLRKAQPEVAAKPAPLPQETPSAPSRKEESSTAAPASLVQNIRYWSTSDSTRVIIDLGSDASYKKEHLTGPNRIYFDISNAKISRDFANRTIAIRDDYLKQVRVAPNRSDVVRVVLDISEKSNYTISELHNPFRIVIDLRGSEARSFDSPLLQSSTIRPDETIPIDTAKQVAAERKPVTKVLAPANVTERNRSAPSNKRTETKPPLFAKGITETDPSIYSPSSTAKTQAPATSSVAEPKVQGPYKAVIDLRSSRKESKPSSSPAVADTEKNAESKKDGSAAKTPAAAKIQPAAKTPPAPSLDSTKTPKAAPQTSHGDRTLTRSLGLKIGRIVIDPGHGGHDEGTTGPNGLLEKDLVLSLARALQTMLQDKLGAEVFLTRDSDTFIPLEERTAIANQHRADLFISIHANSSRIRSISGVETYYLDFAKTNAEREIAARENAASDKNVSDLEDLIKKIAKADKSAESRELASLIQQKLYLSAKKLFPKTHDRGVRSAPFIVLIGANMPSVLAEVAFISNPNDEKLLDKKTNQEALAKALFAGIEGYVNTLGSQIVNNQKNPK
jgi:N-acetylmuramoyl-L-alanine amidase